MRFFRDLVLTIAVAVCLLALLEAGLRLAGVKFEASLYTAEAERGYALRAGAVGWTISEGENYVRINSDGMCDEERLIERPTNVLRIAVIGSSEAEAQQVPQDQTFEAVMERQLNVALAVRGYRVEVLNFGVPGYNLTQEYLTLQNHAWKYRPQIVMLSSTAAVLTKNIRAFYPGPTQGAPFYRLEHGQLVPDQATRQAARPNVRLLAWKDRLSVLVNQSRILQALDDMRNTLPQTLGRLSALFRKRVTAKRSVAAVEGDRVYDPQAPELQESWAITDAFLRLMKRDCEQHGAEFWLAMMDSEKSTDPDMQRRSYFERSLGLNSLFLTDQRMSQMARTDGLRVVTLSPTLAAYAARHHVALHGFFNTSFNTGHWNALGHKQAGMLISQALLSGSDALRTARIQSAKAGGSGEKTPSRSPEPKALPRAALREHHLHIHVGSRVG